MKRRKAEIFVIGHLSKDISGIAPQQNSDINFEFKIKVHCTNCTCSLIRNIKTHVHTDLSFNPISLHEPTQHLIALSEKLFERMKALQATPHLQSCQASGGPPLGRYICFLLLGTRHCGMAPKPFELPFPGWLPLFTFSVYNGLEAFDGKMHL